MFNALYESVSSVAKGATEATATALLSPIGLADSLPSTTPELEDAETKARQVIENAHDDLPAWGPLDPEDSRKPFTLRIGQGDISDLNFQMTTAEMKVMYEHSKRDAAARRARPLMIRMYGEDWLTETRRIDALVRKGFDMDDNDITQLSEGLANGWFPLLRHLWLDDNTFTDEGVYALCRAKESGKCPALVYVSIEGCDEVTDEGEQALNRALGGNERPVETWESKVEERRAEHAKKQAEEAKEKEQKQKARAMAMGTGQIAG